MKQTDCIFATFSLFFLHFDFSFCIFASDLIIIRNKHKIDIIGFWRSPQDVLTPATNLFGARHKILLRPPQTYFLTGLFRKPNWVVPDSQLRRSQFTAVLFPFRLNAPFSCLLFPFSPSLRARYIYKVKPA